MQPTQELVDDIYRERVLRARRARPDQKLLAGPELFDMVCKIMKDGIRNQNPGADEQTVREILTARLDLLKRLEDAR